MSDVYRAPVHTDSDGYLAGINARTGATGPDGDWAEVNLTGGARLTSESEVREWLAWVNEHVPAAARAVGILPAKTRVVGHTERECPVAGADCGTVHEPEPTRAEDVIGGLVQPAVIVPWLTEEQAATIAAQLDVDKGLVFSIAAFADEVRMIVRPAVTS